MLWWSRNFSIFQLRTYQSHEIWNYGSIVRGLSSSSGSVGIHVLAGPGANDDTTTASERLVFGIFATLTEFEGAASPGENDRGPVTAHAEGRNSGRPCTMARTS